jgi:hypothetical protein
VGLHGELYGIRIASLLFARGLNKTKEFHLASNVGGAADAFDDLVFKYELKGQSVCKTCFIQLKHKRNIYTINPCALKQLSGDFSLFKYFKSYCKIKREAFKDHNLKLCGSFDNFEFIIYTNAKLGAGFVVKGADTNPVNILSSGKNLDEYVTFDENCNSDIFDFFEELLQYYNLLLGLENIVNLGACVGKVEQCIENSNIHSSLTSADILGRLKDLKSKPGSRKLRDLMKELEKCDFSLCTEFLQKLKIFHSQSNVNNAEALIRKELQVACHTSLSGTNSLYTKFEKGLTEWWEESGSVSWLSDSSDVWQSVKQYLIEKIRKESKREVQESIAHGVNFNQMHMRALSHGLQLNNLLHVTTSRHGGSLSKLKIYKAVENLGYRDPLFVSLKSLINRHEEILLFWPCKWSSVLVIDCEQVSDNVDDNWVDILMDVLRQSEKKIVVILQCKNENLASCLELNFKNNYVNYEDKVSLLDLDEESQKNVLKRTVDFQGTEVPLQELIGKDPPETVKQLIDSDVLSLLLSGKKKLSIGRKLSDLPSYYVHAYWSIVCI